MGPIMQETIYSNARIVLADEVVVGSLVVRDGLIADIGTSSRLGEDMEGDLILMQDLYAFEQTGIEADGRIKGEFKYTGLVPYAVDRFERVDDRLQHVGDPRPGDRWHQHAHHSRAAAGESDRARARHVTELLDDAANSGCGRLVEIALAVEHAGDSGLADASAGGDVGDGVWHRVSFPWRRLVGHCTAGVRLSLRGLRGSKPVP